MRERVRDLVQSTPAADADAPLGRKECVFPAAFEKMSRSLYCGTHGVEKRERDERGREREKKLHSPLAPHALTQWAI